MVNRIGIEIDLAGFGVFAQQRRNRDECVALALQVLDDPGNRPCGGPCQLPEAALRATGAGDAVMHEQHGITPTTIAKAIRDLIETEKLDTRDGRDVQSRPRPETLALDELLQHIAETERAMKKAAKDLDFERAAELRDEIASLKKFLPDASWRKS